MWAREFARKDQSEEFEFGRKDQSEEFEFARERDMYEREFGLHPHTYLMQTPFWRKRRGGGIVASGHDR
jgi:hypothetical protein